eukprot:1566873-Rhodomonas_salina.1
MRCLCSRYAHPVLAYSILLLSRYAVATTIRHTAYGPGLSLSTETGSMLRPGLLLERSAPTDPPTDFPSQFCTGASACQVPYAICLRVCYVMSVTACMYGANLSAYERAVQNPGTDTACVRAQLISIARTMQYTVQLRSLDGTTLPFCSLDTEHGSLAAYTLATRCPVLTSRMGLLPGWNSSSLGFANTGVWVCSATCLRDCYAMSGTDLAHGSICLCAYCTCPVLTLRVCCYVLAMRCPVLTWRIMLPGSPHRKLQVASGYGLSCYAQATRCPVLTWRMMLADFTSVRSSCSMRVR